MAAQLTGTQYKNISLKRAVCAKFLPINCVKITLEGHAKGACCKDHENCNQYANGQKKSPAKIDRSHMLSLI
jgi:hypothetical protein